MRSRIALFVVLVLAPLALWAGLPLVSSGQSGKAARLDKKIDSARSQLNSVRKRKDVLSTDISAASKRIRTVQGDINVLQGRQNVLQTDLDRKRSELNRIQDDLREQRARLARMRAKLALSRRVLSRRLLELYKADRPDIVTVILNSKGFADLLERGEFIQRINDQDQRVIRQTRVARDVAQRASTRLARLEDRQQRVTAAVLARRNEVATVKLRLVDKRSEFAGARAAKAELLTRVRSQEGRLEEDLAAMEREQAKISGILNSPGAAGPVRRGSGRLIWPVNGSISSPFGQRWGRLHAGIDIPAPSGTPIRAADSGKVVIAGPTGGYGNYTCVAHGGGFSTCYAHQSAFGTSTGASVRQGQVIGYVGNTGNSFGAHLHFETRVNGSPVDPMGYL